MHRSPQVRGSGRSEGGAGLARSKGIVPLTVERTAGARGALVNLQALRALAAMMVVFFHSADLAKGGRQWFGGGGGAGVDLFFVLSGFIMVYTTADGEPDRRRSCATG